MSPGTSNLSSAIAGAMDLHEEIVAIALKKSREVILAATCNPKESILRSFDNAERSMKILETAGKMNAGDVAVAKNNFEEARAICKELR